CERPCPSGHFGANCEEVCECENGATCDPISGHCSCQAGWRGRKCSRPCLKGYFGRHCSQTCRCSNQKPCDHITGKCQCPKGYTGHGCTEHAKKFPVVDLAQRGQNKRTNE
ncbi:laminin EGF-like protein, partial [Teladorsagia circumcincta]